MQVIQNQYIRGQNAKIDKVTKEQDVKHYNWSPSYLKIFYSKHIVSMQMGCLQVCPFDMFFTELTGPLLQPISVRTTFNCLPFFLPMVYLAGLISNILMSRSYAM